MLHFCMDRRKCSATGETSSKKKAQVISGACCVRSKKCKKWSDVSMGMAINRAAVEYNVPKTTLLD